jgi:serine/threonine protein kinase
MDWNIGQYLNKYLNNNLICISIFTKLNLLCQITEVLRFLRDNNIVHMDVRPENLIVGKGLLLRLNNFGLSYKN